MAVVAESIAVRLARESPRVLIFRRRLVRWFAREGRSFPWRSPSASSYARVVSEILLQRTRAVSVGKFLPAFLERFASWRQLANATENDLQTFLEPIGLWRRRAASLLALAQEMEAREGRFPVSREEIETLPGIGQYVASAVMLFNHGAAEPLLDVNMARVLERFFGPRKLVDIRYDPWLQALAHRVVDCKKAMEVNWGVLDLAAKICITQNPLCDSCPLGTSCRYTLRARGGRRRPASMGGPYNDASRQHLRRR